MVFKIEKYNFTVKVTPDSWWPHRETEGSWKRKANNIATSIKRHVDDIADVRINWETHHVCSHCGYTFDKLPIVGDMCCWKAKWEKYLENSRIFSWCCFEGLNGAVCRYCCTVDIQFVPLITNWSNREETIEIYKAYSKSWNQNNENNGE
jgi:hypothetical protein